MCSTTYGDDVCIGCKRTFEEVNNWNRMSDRDKNLINERLKVGEKKRNVGEQTKLKIVNKVIDVLTNSSSFAPNMSTNSIARSVGVGQPVIYYHFNTKEILFTEAMDYCKKERPLAFHKIVDREKMCDQSFIHSYLDNKGLRGDDLL